MFARIADYRTHLAPFQRKHLKRANEMPLNVRPLCAGWFYSVLKTEIGLVVIAQASSEGSNE